jgi:hypothetical protein
MAIHNALNCSVSFNVDEPTFIALERLHKQTFKAEYAAAPIAISARIAFKTGLAKLLRDSSRKLPGATSKRKKKGTNEG